MQSTLNHAILNLPLQKRQVLSAQKGGLASSGKLPGAVKPYCLVPPDANAKGGCHMTLDNVLQLFVIIGGTVGITFKISWAIFQEIHNNKK